LDTLSLVTLLLRIAGGPSESFGVPRKSFLVWLAFHSVAVNHLTDAWSGHATIAAVTVSLADGDRDHVGKLIRWC